MKRVRFKWGLENTGRLIKSLSEHKILWDKTHPNYYDWDLREIAYSAIMADLRDILPDDANIGDLQTKINVIRSAHRSALTQKHKPWFYEMTYFLRGDPPPESTDVPFCEESSEEKDPDFKWSEELVFKLLHYYKQHPVLWDAQHVHHSERVKRKQANFLIAKKLAVKGVNSKEVSKKLWTMEYVYKKWLKKGDLYEGVLPFWFDDMRKLHEGAAYSSATDSKAEEENLAVIDKDDKMSSANNLEECNDSTKSVNMEIDMGDKMISEDNLEESNDFTEFVNIEIDKGEKMISENNLEESNDFTEFVNMEIDKGDKMISEDNLEECNMGIDETEIVDVPNIQVMEKQPTISITQMPETSKMESVEPSPEMEKVQKCSVNKLVESKFNGLVKEMISTINGLQDEETIYDLINSMQKLLREAKSSDKLIFRPEEIIEEFQERRTLTCESADDVGFGEQNDDRFEMNLTFRTTANTQSTLEAVAQLPNLENIQLTGRHFQTAFKTTTQL